MGFQSSGGAYVPSANYDRTGAIDANGALQQTVVRALAPISVIGNTSLTALSQDGQLVVIKNAAGATVTLPAATGSGAYYRIWVGVTLTSGSLIVQVANSNDFLRGAAYTVGAAQASFLTANTGTTATESDTVTFNRTTSGLGTIGDYLEFIDLLPNVWSVELEYASSGSAITPFSAAV